MNSLNYEKLSKPIAFSNGWVGLYELTQREHKHFHPSGEVTPSLEDKKLTRAVKLAGELLKINLLDHIIIGFRKCYFSFKENELI